jgi:hypothetical protein
VCIVKKGFLRPGRVKEVVDMSGFFGEEKKFVGCFCSILGAPIW